MKLKPFKHQEKFAKGYDGKKLLIHEGGTGKTICACLWLKDGRDEDALIVCPARVVKKTQKALVDWGTKATVLTHNQFIAHPVKEWSAIVIDEADELASPLFLKKRRSKISTAMYRVIHAYQTIPVILLTATPVRSTPWNLHTLLCFIGEYIDWKVWRKEFFELVYPDKNKYRFLVRPSYLVKQNWRDLIKPYLSKYGDIVLFSDCVDDLPPVTHEQINVPTPKFVKDIDSTPFFDEHKWEQRNKGKEIIKQGKKFRKILVVAYYKEQIKLLEEELSKDKPVFVVSGDIKSDEQEDVVKQAQETDDCYLIVQASVGAGFDADTFSCIIFASMSYAVRDFVQMKFRVRRIHNLHPVKYIYLFGGRCDKAVFENVEKGKTFVPSEWMSYNNKHATTGADETIQE